MARVSAEKSEKDKSLEFWIWDAASFTRGAKDAPKYKDFILPLIFTNRIFDAETYRPIAVMVDELDVVDLEAKQTENALRKILKQMGK